MREGFCAAERVHRLVQDAGEEAVSQDVSARSLGTGCEEGAAAEPAGAGGE